MLRNILNVIIMYVKWEFFISLISGIELLQSLPSVNKINCGHIFCYLSHSALKTSFTISTLTLNTDER